VHWISWSFASALSSWGNTKEGGRLRRERRGKACPQQETLELSVKKKEADGTKKQKAKKPTSER
jgi:hypothetical protein